MPFGLSRSNTSTITEESLGYGCAIDVFRRSHAVDHAKFLIEEASNDKNLKKEANPLFENQTFILLEAEELQQLSLADLVTYTCAAQLSNSVSLRSKLRIRNEALRKALHLEAIHFEEIDDCLSELQSRFGKRARITTEEMLRITRETNTLQRQKLHLLVPALGDTPDGRKYNSAIVGAGGIIYPESLPLSQRRAVFVPSTEAREPVGEAIYVNGIRETATEHVDMLHRLSKETGFAYFGVYLGTRGPNKDVFRVIAQLLSNRADQAVRDRIRNKIVDTVLSNSTLTLVGVSYGAYCVSKAVEGAIKDLSQRLDTEELAERLTKIRILTIGGAGWIFPDGPSYIHVFHTRDPVSLRFGPARVIRDKFPEGVQSRDSTLSRRDNLRKHWWKIVMPSLSEPLRAMGRFRDASPGNNALLIGRTDLVPDTHSTQMYLDIFSDPNQSRYNIHRWVKNSAELLSGSHLPMIADRLSETTFYKLP